MPTGRSAATILATMPNATTPGPDCQTIFRMGGTLRSAERRSCQLLQKFLPFDIWPSPGLDRLIHDLTLILLRTWTHQRCRKPARSLTKGRLPHQVCCATPHCPLIINVGANCIQGVRVNQEREAPHTVEL